MRGNATDVIAARQGHICSHGGAAARRRQFLIVIVILILIGVDEVNDAGFFRKELAKSRGRGGIKRANFTTVPERGIYSAASGTGTSALRNKFRAPSMGAKKIPSPIRWGEGSRVRVCAVGFSHALLEPR